jgi:hypothetical protein
MNRFVVKPSGEGAPGIASNKQLESLAGFVGERVTDVVILPPQLPCSTVFVKELGRLLWDDL